MRRDHIIRNFKNNAYLIRISGVVIVMFSLLLISVGGFSDTSQHKTNILLSENGSGSVILNKIGVHDDGTLIDSKLSNAKFKLFKVSSDGSEADLGIYTTDSEGIIEVKGLTAGKYYFEEVSTPDGYELSLDSGGQPITKFPFEVKSGKEHIPVQLDIDNIRIKGDFEIEKTLKRFDGLSLNQEEMDREFEFKVTFGDKVDNPSLVDDEIYSYTINGSDVLNVKNGGVIKLKHGEKATFKYLKYGIRYNVEEIVDDTYYVTSTNSNGFHLNDTKVSYTNEIQDDKKGMLVINKVVTPLSGQTLPQGALDKVFKFTVTFDDGGTYDAKIMDGTSIKVKSGDTITLKHGDTIMFYDLPLGLNYSIEEHDYQSEGYLPETSKLEGTIGQNTKPISYTFNNKYQDPLTPPEHTELNLDITKEVINPYINEDSFEFKVFFDPIVKDLQYKINDGQLISYNNGDIIKIRHLETIHFVGVPVGTRYRVEELPKEGYESLTKTSSGTLYDKNVSITFYNHSIGEEATQGYLEIYKVVEQKQTQESFDFVLTLDDEVIEFSLKDGEMASYFVPEGTKYTLVEKDYSDSGYVVSIANGQGIVKSGETIEIVATNTYHKELENVTIKGEKTWITNELGDSYIPDSIEIEVFDGNGKIIEILTVKPDQDGKWVYEIKLPKYDSEGKVIKYSIKERKIQYFEASYDCFNILNRYVQPVKVIPHVEKTIGGVNIPKEVETFTFYIEPLNGAPIQSKKPSTVEGEGIALFDSIEFREEGKYQYLIREDQVRDSDYIYDTVPVILTIEIVRDNDVLKVASLKYEKNGNVSSESAKFLNIYKGKPTEPEKPTNPVEPEKPTNPVDPEKPSKPTSPEKPSNPGKPGSSGGNKPSGKLPHTGVAPVYYTMTGFLMLLVGIEFILISMKKHVKTNLKIGE